MGIGADPLVSNAAAPGIVVGPMEAEDMDAVLRIERDSFARPWSRDLFVRELGLPISRSIVARDRRAPNDVIGYLCRWLIGDEMQILNIAVRSDWRRRGVGRALINELLVEAQARGVRSISLEVGAGNLAAVDLYSSLGFRRRGLRRNYYGQGKDGIIMVLQMEGDPI